MSVLGVVAQEKGGAGATVPPACPRCNLPSTCLGLAARVGNTPLTRPVVVATRGPNRHASVAVQGGGALVLIVNASLLARDVGKGAGGIQACL